MQYADVGLVNDMYLLHGGVHVSPHTIIVDSVVGTSLNKDMTISRSMYGNNDISKKNDDEHLNHTYTGSRLKEQEGNTMQPQVRNSKYNLNNYAT